MGERVRLWGYSVEVTLWRTPGAHHHLHQPTNHAASSCITLFGKQAADGCLTHKYTCQYVNDIQPSTVSVWPAFPHNSTLSRRGWLLLRSPNAFPTALVSG